MRTHPYIRSGPTQGPTTAQTNRTWRKMTRPKMKRKADTDNDGKPKKRRYYERKSMRRTNMHLDGTEIGAMLARAAEKQNQGKSVGDGGM